MCTFTSPLGPAFRNRPSCVSSIRIYPQGRAYYGRRLWNVNFIHFGMECAANFNGVHLLARTSLLIVAVQELYGLVNAFVYIYGTVSSKIGLVGL